MKHFAYIEKETGKLLGYNVPNVLKEDVIEISAKAWQEALSINANFYEDGKFIVKDFTTDEQREEQRIQQIEAKCNQVIESVYPIYKQINITNLLTPYTEQDREYMKAFIDSKRAICHKAIVDGTKPEDINWEVTNG